MKLTEKSLVRLLGKTQLNKTVPITATPTWSVVNGRLEVAPDGLSAWVFPTAGGSIITVTASVNQLTVTTNIVVDPVSDEAITIDILPDPPQTTLPPPDIQTFIISPDVIAVGDNLATMTWYTNYADKVTINGAEVNVRDSATLTFTTRQNMTFRLIATGPGGTTELTRSVSFVDPIVIEPHILPAFFKTSRGEPIPNYVRNYTARAITNGYWEDPEIWEKKVAPTEVDTVYIPEGIHVTLRAGDYSCKHLVVFGKLSHETNQNISLLVGTFIVAPEGEYECGTEQAPINAEVKQSVIFRNAPIHAVVGQKYIDGPVYVVDSNYKWNPLTGERVLK